MFLEILTFGVEAFCTRPPLILSHPPPILPEICFHVFVKIKKVYQASVVAFLYADNLRLEPFPRDRALAGVIGV